MTPKLLLSSLFLSMGLLSACKGGSTDSPPDLATPVPDLSGIQPLDLSGLDLRTTPPDLSTVPDLAAADLASPVSCRGTTAPGTTYKLATARLLIPTSASSYSVDIDGNGRPENQFKKLVDVFALAGLDIQGSIDFSTAAGEGIQLLSVTTTNPATSACVGVEINPASSPMVGAPPPKFDGTDVFSPSMPVGARLSGSLTSRSFSTTLPPLQSSLDEQSLQLRLVLGASPLLLPLRGVHLEGTLTGGAGLWQIQNGSIHGVISDDDINRVILPGLATQITRQINSDPRSATATALINLFESTTSPISRAKCMVAANCCRTSPATCLILPAEVAASPVGGVLAPDVEVLDASNKWAPVSGGTSYDAMSFGMGFTAITASY